jgi:RNA polymerase sigma factor (sigma-70 family)
MTRWEGARHSGTADMAGAPVAAGVLDDTQVHSAEPVDVSASGPDLANLFRLHHAELVRLALLMVRDLPTAEDVVQDVFARIHSNENVRPRPGHELAYLRASVLNGCRSVHRRRAVAARLGLEPGTDPAAWPIGNGDGTADPGAGWPAHPPHESAEAEAIRADECRRVLAALAGLPGRRREVLVLRYYVGLSEAEIAATLGISPGSVKSAASRGLATLARKLGEETWVLQKSGWRTRSTP